MRTTLTAILLAPLAILLIPWPGGTNSAHALPIYDIQYTADPSGISPEDGNVVDCSGGIVTHIKGGNYPRLVLQDPNKPDGWGAIQVKGRDGADTFTVANGGNVVNVGDWVSVTGVEVEDYRGTTFLQFGEFMKPSAGATLAVESTGNPLPAPLVVTPDEIAAPVEGLPNEWYVDNHTAEKYESMWLCVHNVTVTNWDLGKAGDNYNLQDVSGDLWASDYMNVDLVDPDDYHLYVDPDEGPGYDIGWEFGYVTGILEQYTGYKNGQDWDYYQLLTTSTGDFHLGFMTVPEPASVLMLLVGALLVLGWWPVRRRRP